jgi:chromatin remodeling complex protein RSC6
VESVFGSKPVSPSDMTKKIWAYVKKHRLGKK